MDRIKVNVASCAADVKWEVYRTVDVDKVADVDWAEAVCGVTDVDSRVIDIHVSYPQYSAVDAVPLPAEVDFQSVLGPGNNGRRRRLDRADKT